MMHTITAGGAIIPALGFGTFRMSGPDTLRMVKAALGAGFTHIDTAQVYDNEAAVGEAIRASGVARSDLFLTTKVWVDNYPEDRFELSVEESLRKLGTDYVDLLLLHWPNQAVSLERQIASLNAVQRSGKARHIGVSNFNRDLFERGVALSSAPIVTNQVELHPFIDQAIIRQAAAAAGAAIAAYYPMADGKVFDDSVLRAIAARNCRSVAQVVLRWIVQQGMMALTKTATESRLAENMASTNFVLSHADMAEIDALKRRDERLVSPPGLAPQWD
jgi:2,5-diketo-D-gluconate reductase B